MRRTLPLLFLLLYGYGCGCGEEPPPPAPPRPVPGPPPAPIAAGRPIAGAGAFGIAPTSEGAVLAWGAPHATGGGVFVLRLGPLGEALGVEQPVVRDTDPDPRPSQTVEVEVAAAGRTVGIAWVLDDGRAVTALAARSPDGGERFRAPVTLGETIRGERGARGRVSIVAGEDQTLIARHRRPAGPCVRYSDRGECAFIARHTIGLTDAPADTRDATDTEVPTPCEPFVLGALHRDGSWFFGLCAAEPEPATHVLVLDPDPQLATPVEVAPGCAPRGIAPLDQGVAVVARCPSGLAVTALDPQGGVRSRTEGADADVSCREGRPVLSLGVEARRHTLRLGPSVGSLEALLPEALAPEGARAVWTGEALLIATPVSGRELVLRRYECVEGDRLDRTDVR